MRVVVPILVAVGLVMTGPSGQAQTILNGSFELSTADPPPGTFSTLSSGSAVIIGWTVGGNGVDYINGFWQASAGTHSLDLSALDTGSISQSAIITVVGQQYRVTFDMAGNPAVGIGNAVKRLTVQATGGSAQTNQFDVTGKTVNNMGWTTMLYDFVATSTTTTLTFTSLEGSSAGPALDNVSIAAIPVPEPTGIVAAVAVAGLGVRAVRRRRVIAG